MNAPTEKQMEVLRYLIDCISKNGFQPSIGEMTDHFGYKSQNSVTLHLAALERKGLVVRTYDSRAIIITAKGRKTKGNEA